MPIRTKMRASRAVAAAFVLTTACSYDKATLARHVQPLMSRITRAADVPGAGHWLIEENPEFVTAELTKFFASGTGR